MSQLRNATVLTVALFFSGSAVGADPNLCAACHGDGGNSTNPEVPSIAGQPRQFLAMALNQFRQGNRKDPEMSPMAEKLSNAEMNELAAYFAEQEAAPPRHRAKPENVQAGPGLAKRFNCSQCHGPQLLGQQHIPRLAGQQVVYLRQQLKRFKAGTRSDLDGTMTPAAKTLADGDIEALVDYLAGLEAK